jgi:hypothetical protein
VKQLVYTRMVIERRCASIRRRFGRQAVDDDSIGGYDIQHGAL